MKFPRNARLLRSHLDAAPFAGVLFCLLIFVLLCSLVYTPGVLIQLPVSNGPQPGVDGPKAFMEVDPNNNYYYQNQFITEENLIKRLQAEVKRQAPDRVTLIVEADGEVKEKQIDHLVDVAKRAGIWQILKATSPQKLEASPGRVPKS